MTTQQAAEMRKADEEREGPAPGYTLPPGSQSAGPPPPDSKPKARPDRITRTTMTGEGVHIVETCICGGHFEYHNGPGYVEHAESHYTRWLLRHDRCATARQAAEAIVRYLEERGVHTG